jgi:hypothetical protein
MLDAMKCRMEQKIEGNCYGRRRTLEIQMKITFSMSADVGLGSRGKMKVRKERDNSGLKSHENSIFKNIISS